MLDIVLNTLYPFTNALSGLYIFSYLILLMTTRNRYYYDLHFIDEETESGRYTIGRYNSDLNLFV